MTTHRTLEIDGQEVFVDWKIDAKRAEVAVRRKGSQRPPQGTGTWYQDVWSVPGLRERLGRLPGAHAFSEPVDAAGRFDHWLLYFFDRRAP